MLTYIQLLLHRQVDKEEARASVHCLDYVLTKELRWIRSQPGDNARTLFETDRDAERAFRLWLLGVIEKEVENANSGAFPSA
jgi:hypothetical protein